MLLRASLLKETNPLSVRVELVELHSCDLQLLLKIGLYSLTEPLVEMLLVN